MASGVVLPERSFRLWSAAARRRFSADGRSESGVEPPHSKENRRHPAATPESIMSHHHLEVDAFAATIRDAGWFVTPPMIASERLDALSSVLDAIPGDGKRGGIRNLLDLPQVRDLAACPTVRGLAEAVLGHACSAVRGLFFDKTPGANWKVSWHQDLTIAVTRRVEVPGYGPWSEKAGVPHVQPPAEVLERMLAIRVHLDDCGPENGPVRVLPGSHRSGKLDSEQIHAIRERTEPVDCVVERGSFGVSSALAPCVVACATAGAPEGRPPGVRVVRFA